MILLIWPSFMESTLVKYQAKNEGMLSEFLSSLEVLSLIFDPRYKHRVTCFLLSHANAFPSDFGQMALLTSMATVADKGKSRILLPSIKTLVVEATSLTAAGLFLTMSEELTVRLLASYDVEAAGTLNNDPESWEVFLNVVRTFLRPGMCAAELGKL